MKTSEPNTNTWNRISVVGNPNTTGKYECVVLIAKGHGVAKREIRSLDYDYVMFERLGWVCEDMIVTHWRRLPEMPKEVI